MATIKEQFEKLQDEIKRTRSRIDKTEPYDGKKHEDKTRSTLALIFVWGYFIILAAAVLLSMINNLPSNISNLNQTLL